MMTLRHLRPRPASPPRHDVFLYPSTLFDPFRCTIYAGNRPGRSSSSGTSSTLALGTRLCEARVLEVDGGVFVASRVVEAFALCMDEREVSLLTTRTTLLDLGTVVVGIGISSVSDSSSLSSVRCGGVDEAAAVVPTRPLGSCTGPSGCACTSSGAASTAPTLVACDALLGTPCDLKPASELRSESLDFIDCHGLPTPGSAGRTVVSAKSPERAVGNAMNGLPRDGGRLVLDGWLLRLDDAGIDLACASDDEDDDGANPASGRSVPGNGAVGDVVTGAREGR